MKKLAHVSMVVVAAFLLFVPELLEAQRRGGGGRGGGGGGFRGGGGGMSARSSARMSVSRPSRASFSGGNRASRVDRTPRADRGDFNRGGFNRVDRTPRADRGDFNRIDRGDVNINRDIYIDNNNGGWWNRDYDGCCSHPLAATAALGTAAAYGYAAATAGSYYSTLPYYGCTESVVNGVPYWDCGNSWYQPTFYGIDAAYVAVAAPS
jgi:hypothetical protein